MPPSARCGGCRRRSVTGSDGDTEEIAATDEFMDGGRHYGSALGTTAILPVTATAPTNRIPPLGHCNRSP